MSRPPAPAQPTSLLLVEDCPDLRELLAFRLARQFPDTRLYLAMDGLQGMALNEQHDPDLIICDFTMQRLDGAEMARAIKSRWPNRPIILLSGRELLDDRERRPFDALLRKPVDFAQLYTVIHRFCHRP